MSNKVRCLKCKGQKEYSGIGGIMKSCEPCGASGYVEKVNVSVAQVEKEEEIVHIEPVSVSAVEAFESMGVPAEIIAEALTIVPEIVQVPAAVVVPEIDEFTQAVIDEPRLDPIAWQEKYKHVTRLFGMTITGHFGELVSKVERAAIRANYASNQVIGERTVDLSVSQDAVSRGDNEYTAYQAQEKKLIAENAANEKKKKASK